MLLRSLTLSLIWLGLIAYSFLYAPPSDPNTWELIKRMSLGQFEGINPMIVCLFNLMGVLPMIWASVLLSDGRGQRVPAWPFVLLSFGVGVFALLPYLILRRPNPSWSGEKGHVLRLLDARWTGRILALVALSLFVVGLTFGDWGGFAEQWRNEQFIHVMSIDFLLVCLLFPVVMADDMKRRNWYTPQRFWGLALLPLLGPCLYLALRPSLPQSTN